jgi:hypothetical protein
MPRNFPELSLRRHDYSQVEPRAGWLQFHLNKPGRRAIPHRTDQSGAHSLRDPIVVLNNFLTLNPSRGLISFLGSDPPIINFYYVQADPPNY